MFSVIYASDTFWFGIIEAGVIGVVVLGILLFVFLKGRSKTVSSTDVPSLSDTEKIRIEEPGAPTKEPVPAPTSSLEEREETPKQSFFWRGLAKSRSALANGFEQIFGGKVDEDALEALEETLLAADVGVSVAMELCDLVRKSAEAGQDPEALRSDLKRVLLNKIGEKAEVAAQGDGPLAIMVVGVNGSGKTTTIGKLAHRYKKAGKTVMVAAGDTYRAGAIDQLAVWAKRAAVEFVSSEPGADPGSVMYNALNSAKAKGIDVVIIDTAGRLQAQLPLMDELKKMVRVAKKVIPDAPHETLLVLDATIGQNALMQAQGFKDASPVSGVALTKLDGTAKGGVVIAVKDKIGIPVKLVGLGEQIDDLRDFDPVAFVDALLDPQEKG